MAARRFNFDCGDSTVRESLKQRLTSMREDLGDLKRELEIEKKFLQTKKEEIYGACGYLARNMSADDSRMSIQPKSSRGIQREGSKQVFLDKTELLKIRGQCDKELENLDTYISHLGDLRKNWVCHSQRSLNIKIPEIGQKTNQKHEKRPNQGKIFYVDGDQY